MLYFQRNTFQAVLATDGHHSYAIFNYLKIVWTTGSNSGGETETGLNGDPAVVGIRSAPTICLASYSSVSYQVYMTY